VLVYCVPGIALDSGLHGCWGDLFCFLAMAALRKNSCTFVLWCIYRACLQVILTSCLSGGTQKCPEVNIKPSGSCLVIFSRNYVPCWIPLLVMDPKATQHRYRYNIPPAGIPRQGCGELWLCLLTGTWFCRERLKL